MKTTKEIIENLSESSPFVEKAYVYYLMTEDLIECDTVLRETISRLMFDALLGKQEAGELPGILNPENSNG